MLFKKEDLRNLMIEGVAPFELISETDESSGHRQQRMTVYIFRFEDKLYEFGLTYDENEGQHWHEIAAEEECPEVVAHQVTTTEYRYA